jgi:dTDP-4-amino-4,6-dideoxygalactose transaminase
VDKLPHIQISQPQTGEEEWHAVREPLVSGWLTQGPQVAAFERAFAERHRVKHALATTSCTTALHLALEAMGIGPGDEVIVPAFTWVATANAVEYCGARPVFVDVETESFNLDPAQLAQKVSERTRAIIAVHLFGRCADMERIAKAAPGVALIEDAACAAGSAYRGRPAGSLGKVAAFSFHPRKSITTGEGGMVTTDDAALAGRVESLRNHGASMSAEQRSNPRPALMPDYDLLGYNYRMTDVQGAIGLVQLRKLDALIDERQQWTDFYLGELSDLDWLRLPRAPQGDRHGWQSYVCMVDESRAPVPRDQIMDRLFAAGISTRPGTQAVHMLGYYRNKYRLDPDAYPGARDCARYSMAIPLHNRMAADDYRRVVQALRAVK